MVKGNKFKPFEPPKKRQKRGHKSVLIEPLVRTLFSSLQESLKRLDGACEGLNASKHLC